MIELVNNKKQATIKVRLRHRASKRHINNNKDKKMNRVELKEAGAK